jgi:hypothetical protein
MIEPFISDYNGIHKNTIIAEIWLYVVYLF